MFHILYFLPYTSRDRYTRLRNTIINQFYFLIIQVNNFHAWKSLKTSSPRYTFSLKKHRFNRWDVSFEIVHCLKKKKNRCGSRLKRKVGWNNVRFRLKRWLNKRFPRDYLPAGTAPVNACNTRVDDAAAAAATNLVRVPCWVKGMWRVCVLETWIEVQRVGELLGKCMTAGRRGGGGGRWVVSGG